MRPEVHWFALCMERTLQDHDGHKVGWHHLSSKWLLNRLRQETDELRRAVDQQASAEEIIREATDVANFAMMIADNAAARTEPQ